MSKFHINSKGEAGKCSATTGKCPFGDSEHHYKSMEEAAVAAMEAEVNAPMTYPAEVEGFNVFTNMVREASLYDRLNELSNRELMKVWIKGEDEARATKNPDMREASLPTEEIGRRLTEGTLEERLAFRKELRNPLWSRGVVWKDTFPDAFENLELDHREQTLEQVPNLTNGEIRELRRTNATPEYLYDIYEDELEARGYWDTLANTSTSTEELANLKRVDITPQKPETGNVAPDSFGTYAATNQEGERRAGFSTRAEANLFVEGLEVKEEHFMEGEGLAITRRGKEVAAITPKDGKWLLGVQDIDLNWRRIPRTVGAFDTQREALEAYAAGRR